MLRKFLCRLLGCQQVTVVIKHEVYPETVKKIEEMLAEERQKFFDKWTD